MKKPFPKFDSDEALEAFLETADLDEYDLAAGALPRDEWFARYELFAKDASIHLRLPGRLREAVRVRAMKEGIPAQRRASEAERTRTTASRQEAIVHASVALEPAGHGSTASLAPNRIRHAPAARSTQRRNRW